MKKNILIPFSPVLVWLFLLFGFAGCIVDPIEPDGPIDPAPTDMLSLDPFYRIPGELPPVEYTPEVQEPITNDFTLLKACLGKSMSEIEALLTEHGYTAGSGNTFLKTENGVTKEAYISATNNVSILINNSDFDIQRQIFAQWMNEIQNSVAFTKLVRSSYRFSASYGSEEYFSTPGELLSAINALSAGNATSASFNGNDIYANEYKISMIGLYSTSMQIVNQRIGQPSDDFNESDLRPTDLQKHILISKVDYLTYRYKGFYALNVSDKLNTGNEIPFVSEYQSPGDFGYIKLFYRNTNNLLMDGSIIWNGCGELNFPASFRAGQRLNSGMPYPGQGRIAFINNGGRYRTVTDETDLQRIWQSVSRQKEFQHYYHSKPCKRVAVYLYTPSVGLGDPADAFYLVFTEQ